MEALKALKPCDLDDRLAMFPVSGKLSLKQAIKAGFSVSDLLWVAGKLGFGKECAIFAANCAKRAKQYAAADYAADYAAAYAADAAYYADAVAAYYADAVAAYAVAAAAYAVAAAAYAGVINERELQMKDIVKIFGKIDLP
jgi:hypothetical protein